MKLETQIETLKGLGLSPNKGVSVDDFLLSWSREEYEAMPFDLILLVYGSEIEEKPWGRYFCDRAWNFDVECIEDTGSYTAIVDQFHRIAGRNKDLLNLSDRVDVEGGLASLRYTIDGIQRELEPKIDNDWADPHIVQVIMSDMHVDGYDFYGKDNGQATTWFHMTLENALALNNLADNVFKLVRKPWWKFW